MGVDDAANERFADDHDKTADTDAAIGKACDTGRPATEFGVDDWVGNEGEVEDSVDNGDVDIPKNAATRFVVSKRTLGIGYDVAYQMGSVTVMTKGRLRFNFSSGKNSLFSS